MDGFAARVDAERAAAEIAADATPGTSVGLRPAACGAVSLARPAPHAIVTESQRNPRLNVPSEKSNAPGALMLAPEKPSDDEGDQNNHCAALSSAARVWARWHHAR